jgi:Thiol-activated cytolysin/PKD domain
MAACHPNSSKRWWFRTCLSLGPAVAARQLVADLLAAIARSRDSRTIVRFEPACSTDCASTGASRRNSEPRTHGTGAGVRVRTGDTKKQTNMLHEPAASASERGSELASASPADGNAQMPPTGNGRRMRSSAAVSMVAFFFLSPATGLATKPHMVRNRRLVAKLSLQGRPGTAGSATRFKLGATLPNGDKLKRFTLTFGDGSSTSGARLKQRLGHTYRTSGTFQATLTLVDRKRKRVSSTIRVAVPPSGGGQTLRDELAAWTAGHPAVGDPNTGLQESAEGDSTLGPVQNLFPGAVVHGDATSIENGILTPIPLAPASGTVVLTDVQLQSGGKVSEHVNQADKNSVTQAVQDLRGQEAFHPVGIDTGSLNFQDVTSSQQAATDLQASFSYAGFGKANGDFSEADNQSEHHVLFEMTEKYYGVDYTPDYAPGTRYNDLDAFFAPGTTAKQGQQCGCMGSSMPPMYVSHVTYGTRFLFLANSKADTQEMKSALSASVQYGPASGTANLTSAEKSVLDEMSLQVVAIGGNTTDVGSAMAGALGNGGKDVTDWLANFVKQSLKDGATASVPLSYTLSYLDDHRVGEYAAQPAVNNPIPDGDMIDHVDVDVMMGTDDRTCSQPVTFSLYDNQNEALLSGLTIAGNGGGWNACRTSSPYCPNPQWGSNWGNQGGADYWNNLQSGQPTIDCRIPFPHPVHAYAIAGSKVSIVSPGDSWHAGFAVRFDLPAVGGNNYAGSYISYITTPNMFFDVDAHNGNPCQDASRNMGYTLTLAEPTNGSAISAACPDAITG